MIISNHDAEGLLDCESWDNQLMIIISFPGKPSESAKSAREARREGFGMQTTSKVKDH